MKVFLTALAVLCVATIVQAQTLHHYPDATIAAYGPTVPYPTFSGQCQIRPANANPDTTLTPNLISPSWGHTHVDVTSPYGGEVSQSFDVAVSVLVFDTAGVTSDIYGDLISNVRWDAPGGAPVGDPHALITKTAHVTVDFSKANGNGSAQYDIPKHGWFTVKFAVRTWYVNGYRTDTALYVSFYSMIDPSAPETFMAQQTEAGLESTCSITSPFDTPPDALGLFQVSQHDGWIPVAPIAASFGGPVFLYGYAGQVLPDGTGMIREDMDLHHGNVGTLVSQASGPAAAGVRLPTPFDPVLLGSGTHKIAMIWTQDTQNGIPGVVVPQEQVSSVLVATVTVGGSTQPSAPTLASITPAQVQQGGTVSVMLMGTGFVAGATSVNVPAGVSVSNVVVGSATMLTATFVVAPSLSGSFPVFVATANGTSGSLPFTIIPQAFQSWQPFTPAFERLFDSVTGPLNQIRVCASDGKCSAPMPIQ